MDRYMPVTGIDCTIPSLLIDTQAPLDVLHETAAYRIRTATPTAGGVGGVFTVIWRVCW